MQTQVHQLVLQVALLLLILYRVAVQLQHLRACLIDGLEVGFVGELLRDVDLVDLGLEVLLCQEIHEDDVARPELSRSHEGEAERVEDV